MGQPEPRVSALMQTLCSPRTYEQLTVSKGKFAFYPSEAGRDYWRIVPAYRVARCPICNKAISAQIDTYNIKNAPMNGWFRNNFATLHGHESRHCRHFVTVKLFMHLNGNLPTEVDYLEFYSPEVPSIQPGLVPNDIETYAVLHALPIARIEDGSFVPRYTLYMMAYFAKQPRLIVQRWREKVAKEGVQNPEDYGIWLQNPHEPQQFNLVPWVESCRLYWLDLDKAELPLATQMLPLFPYAGISGRLSDAIFKNGVLREH